MPDAPAAPIALIVSGEGSHQLASIILGDYEVYDWKSPPPADSMAGRQVQLWGSTPEAVAKLAPRYLRTAATVAIIETTEDFSTVLGERGNGDAVVDYIKARLHPIAPLAKIGRPRSGAAPVSQQGDSAVVSWQSLGLECNSGGVPLAMEANVVAVFQNHELTRDRIWFDSFRDEVWHSLNGEPRAWTDNDSRSWMYWMQKQLRLGKFTKSLVHEGVLIYARMHMRNSVHEMIESEPWDGIARIDEWLCDFFGSPRDAHHRAAARNWLIGMVARAYRPGCEMHHVLVMEGTTGRGKTRGLLALASPWSHTLTQRFGSKEFTEAIQGNWLIELGELTALANAAHQKILADITNPDDRYRAPWDRLASDHPRKCVFAGSTEKHNNYLSDTYGIRRFWSVRCGDDVNIEALIAIRQQLFAEALVQWRAGEAYHLMPEQTRDEQMSRVEQDEYAGRIAEYLEGKNETTALDVFEAIFIKRDDYGRMLGHTIMEDKDSKRISKCLRQLGWFSFQGKRKGLKLNLWQPVPVQE